MAQSASVIAELGSQLLNAVRTCTEHKLAIGHIGQSNSIFFRDFETKVNEILATEKSLKAGRADYSSVGDIVVPLLEQLQSQVDNAKKVSVPKTQRTTKGSGTQTEHTVDDNKATREYNKLVHLVQFV